MFGQTIPTSAGVDRHRAKRFAVAAFPSHRLALLRYAKSLSLLGALVVGLGSAEVRAQSLRYSYD